MVFATRDPVVCIRAGPVTEVHQLVFGIVDAGDAEQIDGLVSRRVVSGLEFELVRAGSVVIPDLSLANSRV